MLLPISIFLIYQFEELWTAFRNDDLGVTLGAKVWVVLLQVTFCELVAAISSGLWVVVRDLNQARNGD